MRACRRTEARLGLAAGPPWSRAPRGYFSSTTAPCASSFFFISSASCLFTPSFTVPGAPSTRSFASFRPRLVIARISLMTWIFFSPPAFSTTVNSVCSSTAGAAPAAPAAAPPAGAAAGAAIVTPNLRLRDRLAFDQPDLDGRLLELLGKVRQDLRGADRIRARQHQRGRPGEERSEAAGLQLLLAQRAARQRVLDHHVLDADRPQAPAQVGDVRHVETREIGDVDRLRLGDLRRQRRDHLLLLRFGAVHTWYPAGSTRTPGPIVLETVTERM